MPGSPGERQTIESLLTNLKFEVPEITYNQYMEDLGRDGGIVEEWIQGEEYRSPSAQLRITPLGQIECLSTHDQVLGGPTGQTFIGARFPADKAYAVEIMQHAAKVSECLAKEGVIGRFAIDFVSVKQSNGSCKSYAIELNLRKGGTTHPFLTLQFLTDGIYDAEAGVFRTAQGKEKYYLASDRVESPLYCAFTHENVFDIVAQEGLHFNQSQQTGVVLCMMTGIGEFGRLGLTAIGDSHEDAENLFQCTVSALDKAATRALNP